MSRYNLTVPGGINSFDYGGTTYGAGSSYSTDNPCDAIGFYNASRTTNPQLGRANNTPNFWQEVDQACAAQPAADPQPNAGTPPVETDPNATGGDSAVQQGAPNPPASGNVVGNASSGAGDPANPNPAPTEEPTRPPVGEPHPTHGGEQSQEQTNGADPVDIFSGTFYIEETDITIPNTILPLAFTRFYRSGAASFGPFGWNWDHNYNLFIRELNTGDIALWRNLHEEQFQYNGADYDPPRGVFEKLQRVSSLSQVYELLGDGGMVMRFERPSGWVDGERIPIYWIRDRHGNQLTFSYGAEDKLVEVRDDDDHFFTFEYDLCGLCVAVSDQSGRKFLYEHDEQTMQLTAVRSPAITDHPDGITRYYHYEHPWALPELRHNIVRVEDAKGNVYLENVYEQDPATFSYSRITEQLYGGYLFQFRYTQLQYVAPDPLFINIPSVQIEVMNPDYGLETYTFNYRGDLLDRRYRLNKDMSFRVVAWLYEFDEQGNLHKTTRPDGSEEINTFDFSNADPRMRNKILQKEVTSAAGFPSPSRIIWRGKYEPAYQLLKEETNEMGATTIYRYDFDVTPAALNNTGKLIEIVQPDATLPDGTIQQAKNTFTYNPKGQVTASIQPNGTRMAFEYGTTGNEKSRLVKRIFDEGILNIQNIIGYDSVGFDNVLIDGNGHSSIKVYNALGLVEKEILPDVNGSPADFIYHYNADKKLILSEKPKGAFTDPVLAGTHITDSIECDVLGYSTKHILSSNTSERVMVRINNDFRGFPVEAINPNGSRILKRFDERGLPLIEEVVGTDGKKIISKKVYDRAGKIIQDTNAFGLTTRYEYDGFSRISKVILPNGTEIRNKWLAEDLLESEETVGDDGTGTIRQLSFKSFAYDEKKRKIAETIRSFTNNPALSSNVTTTFFYDVMDRIVKIINNRGGVTIKEYDGVGRVIRVTDPMGNEEYNTYDHNGNLIQIQSYHHEPDGSISQVVKKYAYDERNRRTEMIEPDGATVLSEYDDRNLLVRQTDYLGVVKEMVYNSFGKKVREVYDTGGLNIQHEWRYNEMMQVSSYTDPAGEISTYAFDSVGRNFKVTYANGFSSTKTFNAFGQIIKETLASGVEFEYAYDTANRITRIENTYFPTPIKKTETHQFTYDGCDRVVTAIVGTRAVSREYDSQGRLSLEDALGVTMTCRYHDDTGVVEKVWPDGRKERLKHDLNGVLSAVEETVSGTLGSGTGSMISFVTSGPNAFGRATYAGGLTIENTYDERKRVIGIHARSLTGTDEQILYRYNSANRLQVEAILGQNPKPSYFEYDACYRLTEARDAFPVAVMVAKTQAEHDNSIYDVRTAAAAATHIERFLYNSADARTKYSETGSPDKNYSYVAGHKISNDGAHGYTWHTDSVLKSDSVLDFETDALGRIVVIKSGASAITEIIYDAFGRPSVIRQSGKPDRSFHYLGGFVEQENENGIAVRQITIHPFTGIPIAYHTTSGTHYTLFDNRFNLVALADNNGNVIETYRYKSFGAPTIYSPAGTAIPLSSWDVEPIFGGQRYLYVSGLYLSKKRLMNPVNGIFLSPDPKGYIDSPSLYVYSGQDPINNIDPNGEVIPFIVAAFVIGGALVGAGYSVYDAYHHPERYEGWQGSARVLGNVFGGAIIGGVAIVASEAILAAGGAGIFASGTGAASLTAGQTFVLYGTASATGGAIGRFGFNNLFPEYINPVSTETIATDFVIGGGIPVLGSALRQAGGPVVNGAREMFTRTMGGNWRAFGNTWRMLRNPRIQYTWRRIFWDPRSFENVSSQYWRVTRGANGNALHHLWFQNQSRWVPQGLRNAGFNLLEIPGALNTWMGGRLGRELAFRGIVTTILTGTGVGSYAGTSALLDWATDETQASSSRGTRGTNGAEGTRGIHPNETTSSK
ncbi:DUF6531 domain-containing protein [Chryseosolibacter indicus]|uniref:RHS repeat-associated core domain-containing protein n=1 Tax=Chryseosolibacter indicus TaxID=2782351 RepID=A0ABS5VU20_9BACT|nr:DUF6531 domain-containing protein [Chryseosolibacter indicus]MBT1704922.1 hypothetical protein [Chryseosolibacter indicus]